MMLSFAYAIVTMIVVLACQTLLRLIQTAPIPLRVR